VKGSFSSLVLIQKNSQPIKLFKQHSRSPQQQQREKEKLIESRVNIPFPSILKIQTRVMFQIPFTMGKSSISSGRSCYVSVIVNNVKPYQKATANGPKGVSDYSKWYYIVSTRYGVVNEGQNKLTAKLSCLKARECNY